MTWANISPITHSKWRNGVHRKVPGVAAPSGRRFTMKYYSITQTASACLISYSILLSTQQLLHHVCPSSFPNTTTLTLILPFSVTLLHYADTSPDYIVLHLCYPDLIIPTLICKDMLHSTLPVIHDRSRLFYIILALCSCPSTVYTKDYLTLYLATLHYSERLGIV